MAEPHKLLTMIRPKNLFEDIAAGKKRKMPCGDIRVAVQLSGAGLIRLTGKRNDVTTSWVLTELGKTYVN